MLKKRKLLAIVSVLVLVLAVTAILPGQRFGKVIRAEYIPYQACPVCAMLRVERAALEREILTLGWKINDAEDVLRELYQDRLDIQLRIHEIVREIIHLENRLSLICLLDPTGIVCYIAMLRTETRIGQLEEEKSDLEWPCLANIETFIEVWKAWIKQWEGEIRQHRERIEAIDREIASCRYPPEH